MKSKSMTAVILGAQIAIAWAGHRAWTRVDSWYRPPPEQWSHGALPLTALHVVDAKRTLAEAMLVNESARPPSLAEASNLSQVNATPEPSMTFYLVRAVYLNEATGSFYVSQKGSELKVHHGCSGGHAVPMKRTAVIVQLRESPTEVFVTCSMAE